MFFQKTIKNIYYEYLIDFGSGCFNSLCPLQKNSDLRILQHANVYFGFVDGDFFSYRAVYKFVAKLLYFRFRRVFVNGFDLLLRCKIALPAKSQILTF